MSRIHHNTRMVVISVFCKWIHWETRDDFLCPAFTVRVQNPLGVVSKETRIRSTKLFSVGSVGH